MRSEDAVIFPLILDLFTSIMYQQGAVYVQSFILEASIERHDERIVRGFAKSEEIRGHVIFKSSVIQGL